MSISRIFYFFCLIFGLSACLQNELPVDNRYQCASNASVSDDHPLSAKLQAVLDSYNRSAFVGASLTLRDEFGVWQGAAGKADVEWDVDMQPCNSFLIASISKVFTASLIFLLIEDNFITLDTIVSNFLSEEINENVANVRQMTIRNLLAHTSGIPDYYTDEFDRKRYSVQNNNWQQEDILKFTYGLPPTSTDGKTFSYSNTNYLLLGMVAEQVTGMKLPELYSRKIFDPLSLKSAYYSTTMPINEALVQGYVDGDGDGVYRNSRNFYQDELKTADGGIAINGNDLLTFFESLRSGKLIRPSSFEMMQSWFDLPLDEQSLFQTKNGLGLEYFENETGVFYGHTGGIDGYLSFMFYYPEEDLDIIILFNSISADSEQLLLMYQDLMAVLFE